MNHLRLKEHVSVIFDRIKNVKVTSMKRLHCLRKEQEVIARTVIVCFFQYDNETSKKSLEDLLVDL